MIGGTSSADFQPESLNDRVLVAIARAHSFEAMAVTGSGTRIDAIVTESATRVSLLSHATHIHSGLLKRADFVVANMMIPIGPRFVP
jgi:hypothetical protein